MFYNSKKSKSKEKLYETEPKIEETKLNIPITTDNKVSFIKYSSDFKMLLNLSTRNKNDENDKKSFAKVEKVDNTEAKSADINTADKIKDKVSKFQISLNTDLNNNPENTAEKEELSDTHLESNKDFVREAIETGPNQASHKRSSSGINKKLETYLSNPNLKNKTITEIVTNGFQKSLSYLNINDNRKEYNRNDNRHQPDHRNTSGNKYQSTYNNYKAINNDFRNNIDQQAKNNNIVEKTKKLLEHNTSFMNNNYKINNYLEQNNLSISSRNSGSQHLNSNTYMEYYNHNLKGYKDANINDNNTSSLNQDSNYLLTRDKLNMHYSTSNSLNGGSSSTSGTSSTHAKYNQYSLKYDMNNNNEVKTTYDSDFHKYSSREKVEKYERKEISYNNENVIAREYHKLSFSMLKKLNDQKINYAYDDQKMKTNFDYSKSKYISYNAKK